MIRIARRKDFLQRALESQLTRREKETDYDRQQAQRDI